MKRQLGQEFADDRNFDDDDDLDADLARVPRGAASKRRKSSIVNENDDHEDDSASDDQVSAAGPNSEQVLMSASNDAAEDEPLDSDAEEMDRNELNRLTQACKEKARRNAAAHHKHADAGVIERVLVTDFMCHKYLQLNLNPRLNFIIGHNGSGKSAILTAVTICLGGKASSTNRAVNLRGLIREGADRAEIEVQIRNRGEEAFQHERYGDSISIVRAITKNGGGGAGSDYKLKSASGTIVSRQKNDVIAVCDHFALQVDNPLLILNQDAAKSFLSTSEPKDLYKLFLRGTQLQQLADDWRDMRQNQKTISETVVAKKARLPELERQMIAAENKMKIMEASQNLEQTIRTLQHHIAWSQVYDLKRDADKLLEPVEAQQSKLDKLNKSLASDSQKDQVIDKEIAELKRQIEAQEGLSQPHRHKLDEFNAQLKVLEAERDDVVAESTRLNMEVTGFREHEATINGRIKDARALISRHASMNDEKNRARQQLDNLQEKTHQLETEKTGLERQSREADADNMLDSIDREQRTLTANRNQAMADLNAAKTLLQTAKTKTSDRLLNFGQDVPQMINEIQQMARRGAFRGGEPVGPIGMHVSLTEPKYATALDGAIGLNVPYAFIVQHPADSQVLRQVFYKYKYGRVGRNGQFLGVHEVIFGRMDDRFDFRQGEPARDQRYVSIIDILKFQSDLVKQTLINHCKIEKIILVENRQVGDELMRVWPHNVTACYDLDANKIGHRGRGNANYASYKKSGSGGWGGLCITESKAKIKYILELIAEKEDGLKRFENELNECRVRKQSIETQKDHTRNQISRIQTELVKTRRQIEAINSQLQDADDAIDTTHLEALQLDLAECQGKIETVKQQFPSVALALRECNAKCQAKRSEIDTVTEEWENAGDVRRKLTEEMEKRQSEKQQIIANKKHWEKKRDEYARNLDQAQAQYEAAQNSFRDRSAIAQEFCDGVVVREGDLEYPSTDRIRKALRESTAALEQRDREVGTFDDAQRDYREKKARFNETYVDIVDSGKFAVTLKKSIKLRREQWYLFRKNIVLRATVNFAHYLQSRGFEGSLKFNHDAETLEMKVQTSKAALAVATDNDQNPNKKQKTKDPRSLSGGERSFSTVSFLIAMWESMSAPIRCLDEFDVFMDSVNRSIAISLIMECHKNNPTCQFVLITPQSIDKRLAGPDVLIQRLDDPKKTWARGQMTIEETFARGRREAA